MRAPRAKIAEVACVATSRLWRVCSGVLARAHRAAGRVARAARYEMRRGRTRGRETDAQLAVRCCLLSRGCITHVAMTYNY